LIFGEMNNYLASSFANFEYHHQIIAPFVQPFPDLISVILFFIKITGSYHIPSDKGPEYYL